MLEKVDWSWPTVDNIVPLVNWIRAVIGWSITCSLFDWLLLSGDMNTGFLLEAGY